MQEIEVLLRFLRYTTNLPAFCWDGTEEMLVKMEEKYCFSEQVQPLLTAKMLRRFLECMPAAYLYEVEDILGIHYFAFLFQAKPIVVGPFVNSDWNDSTAEATLTGAGLFASYLLPYKLYYCSFALLDQRTVVQIITGAVTALLPNSPPYIYQKSSGISDRSRPNIYSEERFDFDSAEQRYALENEFLALIEEGQSEAALAMLVRLSKIPIPAELSRQNAAILNAVFRTLVRRAAVQGGVHPAIVDAISLSYAQKMDIANSEDVRLHIIPAMIHDFSDAVKAAQVEHYSPVIARTINYLHVHISQELDMKQLASRAKCTANHLGRQFKVETGLSIAQYLAKERCNKAAKLLVQTNLPVQEISAHVGYLDNNYFVKVFKNVIGDTPSAYRKKFRR